MLHTNCLPEEMDVKSVAVIGAGAAGAMAASALKAENYFERIRVFERRQMAGGVWIQDPESHEIRPVQPGKLPPDIDPPLKAPTSLPQSIPHSNAERWEETPIYENLTTNVPHIAMSFSDSLFAYGPFVPHYITRQYVENYFAIHGTDTFLQLNTTVEDLSWVPDSSHANGGRWKLTLRKYEAGTDQDDWWEEIFDAVVLANGHYSVPYTPFVPGLDEYSAQYPGKVSHSKFYRSPRKYKSKRVVVIGNSASGHDVAADLVGVAQEPVYVSIRTKSRWDGEHPPPGVEWKPTIQEFRSDDGSIIFSDGSILEDVDAVIYCTGYKSSFPFWNEAANKRPLWDYKSDRMLGNFQHTFLHDFSTIGIVGLPRTLTFRSFEYQAIAVARLWSNRNAQPLPSRGDQQRWELARAQQSKQDRTKFHDVPWTTGETHEYLDFLYKFAGLGTLKGDGRVPPPLTREMEWAINNIRKYPEPGPHDKNAVAKKEKEERDWVIVRTSNL